MAQESAEDLVELGNARAASGDHAEAVNYYSRAVALDPSLAVAHHNRALSLTALGRLREAWAEAEWRFALQPELRDFIRKPPLPRWRGEALEDELIVLGEQGAADMLQYLRFLPMTRERVGAVGLMCAPELRRLVAASFPAVELLPADRPVTWGDYVAFVPLVSLPHALALDEQHIPGEPYLDVPVPAAPDKARSIGMAWHSGEFGDAADARLEEFRPLAESGLPIVSLQSEPTREEQALLRKWGAEDLGAKRSDYFDDAIALRSVRALVTTDGPLAHLAGAMGVPTHLLLSEPADVRWMTGEASPWYPSMRLHRKAGGESWQGLASRVAAALGG